MKTEFRYAVGEDVIECPAGMFEEEETDPLTVAKRELLEETGYESSNRLLPVPTVSYAIRYIGASAGVMITASHNPSKYNGYKVYGSDGCQITTEAAAEILAEIEKIDIFSDVKRMPWASAKIAGMIEAIPEKVLDAFIEEVKKQSVLFGDEINRNVAIVYSPLNGTGLEPVTRVLKETGLTNITVVEEQRLPDGNFPTCPYPNPEIREAMELGLQYCERTGADLLLATDPDCDRCGIAVRDGDKYKLLTGNEVGLLGGKMHSVSGAN